MKRSTKILIHIQLIIVAILGYLITLNITCKSGYNIAQFSSRVASSDEEESYGGCQSQM